MAAQLLDQYGKPVSAASLTRKIATPTMIGMRPAAITTPIRGLDPARLGRLLAAADLGDSLAWQELAAEIERRDLHYLGVLSTRKRSVAQLPITVTPGDESARGKRIADWVRGWVETEVLRSALFDMLDAIGKGWSVMEIDWALEAGNNRPGGFIFRPQRWFEVDYEDGERIVMRAATGADTVPGVADGPPLFGLTEMPPENFVIHRHPSWSGLTIQSGLTRAVAWMVMFKMFTMRDWAIFVQNYGLPMRVGKYGPDASDEDREVLWQAVSDIGGSCAAIIRREMEIEFIEPKSGAGSHELHQARCDWIDSQISKAVLGQTGTADSRQGAHASGAIHRLVQEDIERADALLLAATINSQVVRRMVAFSFGPQKTYPRIAIGRPDEVAPELITQLIQWAGPQGLKIRAQDFYDRFNLTPPEDGDVLVGQTAAATPLEAPEDKPAIDRAPVSRPGREKAVSTRLPQADNQDEPVQRAGGRVALHARLGRMLELHTRQQGSALIDAMSARLASAASDAYEAMSAPVREAVDEAENFADLQERLLDLDLPTEDFQAALQQSIQLAYMMGDAWALEQIDPGALERRSPEE